MKIIFPFIHFILIHQFWVCAWSFFVELNYMINKYLNIVIIQKKSTAEWYNKIISTIFCYIKMRLKCWKFAVLCDKRKSLYIKKNESLYSFKHHRTKLCCKLSRNINNKIGFCFRTVKKKQTKECLKSNWCALYWI